MRLPSANLDQSLTIGRRIKRIKPWPDTILLLASCLAGLTFQGLLKTFSLYYSTLRLDERKKKTIEKCPVDHEMVQKVN